MTLPQDFVNQYHDTGNCSVISGINMYMTRALRDMAKQIPTNISTFTPADPKSFVLKNETYHLTRASSEVHPVRQKRLAVVTGLAMAGLIAVTAGIIYSADYRKLRFSEHRESKL